MEEIRPSVPPSSAPPAFRKSGLTEALGVALLIAGLLVFLALLSHQAQLSRGATPGAEDNLIGAVGHLIASLSYLLLGKSSFLLGPYLLFLGALTLYRGGFNDPVSRLVALLTMLLGSALIGALAFPVDGKPSEKAGGVVGANVGSALEQLFGHSGALIIAVGILIGGILLAIRIPAPVALRKLQFVLHDLAQRLTQTDLWMAPTPSGPRPIVERKEDERRPWLQRVEAPVAPAVDAPPVAAEIPAREAPVKAAPTVMAPPVETSQRSVPPPPRLERRWQSRAEFQAAPPVAVAPKPTTNFHGYFNEDESRFHFGDLGGSTRSVRRRAASPANDSRLLRPLDLSLLDRAVIAPRAAKAPGFAVEYEDEAFAEADEAAPAPEVFAEPENDFDSLDGAQAAAAGPAANDSSSDLSMELDEEEEGEAEAELAENDFDEEVAAAAIAEARGAESAVTESASRAAAPALERRSAAVLDSMVPALDLKQRQYRIPASLLAPAERVAREDVSREIQETRQRLEKVMQDYGIQARVVATQRGPIITLYEIKLEPGVRVARIMGIQDEIKMNLEAPSVRIIAPIPGKPTVGIEIPNRRREPVLLGDLLRSELDQMVQRRDLSIVAGKNIAGEKQFIDLTRLPHLLIAGATGAGKSVYMNAIIASLLYTRSPEDVRFIMIDPKMVELKLYDGIPHLIMPVITDVRRASKALQWLLSEMERRYAILAKLKCRDIRSYNERVAGDQSLPGLGGNGRSAPRMPYIVMVIDELADLMMISAKDVEDSIIRLTQKARAVGIHLIMATQRPSVDVITALIKANCPARIAFQVAQRTDSRTILDMNGAETLLGKGDMLYKSPASTTLVRLQAPLITEDEIEKIVRETRRFGEPSYVDLDDIDDNDGGDDDGEIDEELFQQAWKVVQESGKTSTSYVQRRLRIGYNRAANLIETMEQRGLLGPAIGNKPREILRRS